MPNAKTADVKHKYTMMMMMMMIIIIIIIIIIIKCPVSLKIREFFATIQFRTHFFCLISNSLHMAIQNNNFTRNFLRNKLGPSWRGESNRFRAIKSNAEENTYSQKR